MPQQPNGHAAHQAELERRLEQYLDGDRYALDGFDEFEEVQRSSPVVLNAGEELVLREHQRQRPMLDPASQKLQNDWFAASFENHIRPHVEAITNNFKLLSKEIVKRIKTHNRLVEDLQKERNASVDAHNALVKHVKGIRDELGKDLDCWVQRKDKQFTAELAELRERTISRTGDDLNIMFGDVKKLLHLEFAEKVVKAREELREEFRKETADLIKTKEDLSSEVTALREKVSCLNDDLNATIADATNIMRGELAEEFIKARDEMRKEVFAEVRKEMRQELARGVKMLRTFRKHRKA